MQFKVLKQPGSRTGFRLLTKTLLVMKLTIFLLIVVLLNVRANGLSQSITYSGKNVALKTAFAVVERQTGFVFFYDGATLLDAKPVTITANGVPLESFLKKLLQDQALEYSIKVKTIVISRRATPSENHLTMPLYSDQQPAFLPITGTVVDDKGNPLVDATVGVRGDKMNVRTDTQGRFSINAEPGQVLVVTYIGYQIFEYMVTPGTKEMKVVLKTAVTELQNITVTVNTGYQTQKLNEMTGSVVKVSNEMLNRSVAPGLLERLEGITPGLFFSRNNTAVVGSAPEPGPRLLIRGQYSLQGPLTRPLIVLDNFPYYGDLNDINPNDIEDITILRDAASTSIYGVQGGNGVIVINMKKARLGQAPRLTFTSGFTITPQPDLFRMQVLPVSGWIDMEQQLFELGFYDNDINNTSAYPGLTPVTEILLKKRNGQITGVEANAQLQALRGHDVRNDYLKFLYREATRQSYAINFSAGSRYFSSMVSAGYDKIMDEAIGNGNDRASLRMQTTVQPVKNLEMQVAITYSRTNATSNGERWGAMKLNYRNAPLYQRLTDENGKPLPLDMIFRSSFTDTVGGGKLLDWKYRPLEEFRNRDNTSKQQSLIASAVINYTIIKGFSASLSYQFQSGEDYNRRYSNLAMFATRDLINRYTNLSAIHPRQRNPVPIGGILDHNRTNALSYALRGQLNYDHQWKKNLHRLSGIVGAEARQIHNKYESQTAYGYNDQLQIVAVDPVNSYPLYLGGSATIPGTPGAHEESYHRNLSVYSSLLYTFRNKYRLSASARRDGANIFGIKTNSRSNILWSAGVAWEIAQEPFYKVDWLPDIRIRVSYGFSGNPDPGSTASTVIGLMPALSFTGLPYARIANPPNPDLRWERIRTLNLAIEFATRDQRISGSIDYFIKRSTDVINDERLDRTTGLNSVRSNSADMQGKGIDLTLTTRNIITPKFRWETSFSLSAATSKVIRLKGIQSKFDVFSGDFFNGISFLREGYNPNLFISYQWAGLDPLTGNPRAMLNGKPSTNYDSIVSYPRLEDLVIGGSSSPEYFGNLLNTFFYRNFSLSANITYAMRYYFRRPALSYSNLLSAHVMHSEYLERWQKPGDELYTEVPSFIYPNPSTNRDLVYSQSTVTMERGDHIRLNDIRLDYRVTIRNEKKSFLKSLNLYSSITHLNLLLWKANDVGLDPGYIDNIKPPYSVMIGLNATF